MRIRPLIVISVILAASTLAGQDLLRNLGQKQDFRSRRISSYDRSGGNRDSIVIEPGKTAVLAEIEGPGAIHHIWTTIAAEPFYGRKIVLRIYWDGEKSPSVEAPIGDFFGVGHGLNRNFASLPITCSSEGRARNCYWYMPFRRSCRITVKNEGTRAVDAFYYYVDYRELPGLPADASYFHAQYRQEFPPDERRDYLLLQAEGAGHYVGCNMSVLQRAMGWWGEGDDRMKVDGESKPSLHGTGSEDYFSDAWGMREGQGLFYGCPLQEEDFQAGAKATVYRFHIPDPVPFKKSIEVTIEHGHGNDREDLLSSVAYWYQTEPHRAFPSFPSVSERLPFAFEPPENFVLPQWREETAGQAGAFVDTAAGLRLSAPRLASALSSYYNAAGARYPVLRTDGAADGTRVEFRFPVDVRDLYTVELHFLKAPAAGNIRISGGGAGNGGALAGSVLGRLDGYAKEATLASVVLTDLLLETGPNALVFDVSGKDARSAGTTCSLSASVSSPRPAGSSATGTSSARSTPRTWTTCRPSIPLKRRCRPPRATKARTAPRSAGGPSRPTRRATSASTTSSGPTNRPSSTGSLMSFLRTTGPRPFFWAATTASGSGSTAGSSTRTPLIGRPSPIWTGSPSVC